MSGEHNTAGAASPADGRAERQAEGLTQRPAPRHGDRAADLIFDMRASPARGRGLWIYPACYDTYPLTLRRVQSLQRSFGIPFKVGLFGAAGRAGEVTPSVAVSEPGFYAYTEEDPRPHVVHIVPRRFTGQLSDQASVGATEEEEK